MDELRWWQWYVWRHPFEVARLIWQDYQLAWWWKRKTGMKP